MTLIELARIMITLMLGDTLETMTTGMNNALGEQGIPEKLLKEHQRLATPKIIEVCAQNASMLMSEEDIKATIAFYKSPAGKALLGYNNFLAQHPQSCMAASFMALEEASANTGIELPYELHEQIDAIKKAAMV